MPPLSVWPLCLLMTETLVDFPECVLAGSWQLFCSVCVLYNECWIYRTWQTPLLKYVKLECYCWSTWKWCTCIYECTVCVSVRKLSHMLTSHPTLNELQSFSRGMCNMKRKKKAASFPLSLLKFILDALTTNTKTLTTEIWIAYLACIFEDVPLVEFMYPFFFFFACQVIQVSAVVSLLCCKLPSLILHRLSRFHSISDTDTS